MEISPSSRSHSSLHPPTGVAEPQQPGEEGGERGWRWHCVRLERAHRCSAKVCVGGYPGSEARAIGASRVDTVGADSRLDPQRIDGEVDKRADFDIRCDASPHTDAIQVSNEPSEGLPAIDKNTAGDAAASRHAGIALTQIVGDGNQAAHGTSVTRHTPDDFLLRRGAYPCGMGARRTNPWVAAVALTGRRGEGPSRQIRIYVRNVAVQ